MKRKIIFIVACVFLTACSSQIKTTESKRETVSIHMEETEQPTLAENNLSNQATVTPTQQATGTPSYEMLSPTSILSETGILIEIREDSRITIDPIMGTWLEFDLEFINVTEDQIPEYTLGNSDSFFIKNIQFFRGEEEIPLFLERSGGGGGNNLLEDGTLEITQGNTYQLPSDFTLGQVEHIVALVTFHESLGFSEPIRFILDFIPKERPLG